jgi:hypothetical protein
VKNAAVRLVTQTKKRDHITSKRKSLHWLPIRQRVMYKIAVLAYQCVNGAAPSYLCNLVSLRSVNRRLRNYYYYHISNLFRALSTTWSKPLFLDQFIQMWYTSQYI